MVLKKTKNLYCIYLPPNFKTLVSIKKKTHLIETDLTELVL